MKLCICGDVHWSQYSSIVRSRGNCFSTRLENLIQSMNWVENVAVEQCCDEVIMLGDFFDSSNLNAEEISALSCIQWNNLLHTFLTGNHETNVSSLDFCTNDLFGLLPNARVITNPVMFDKSSGYDVELCFLPYILERDRKSLNEYFPNPNNNRIIFSHNDLKGVQYGQFLSTEGFTIEEIENNCRLFFNGHIHHFGIVTDKIINSGNLTGQNFTEDGFTHKHCIQVYDTVTGKIDFFVNPFALNFYKIDGTSCSSVESVIEMIKHAQFTKVLTVKVNSELSAGVREYLSGDNSVVAYRLIVEHAVNDIQTVDETKFESVDHLRQFEDYVYSTMGCNDIVKDELQKVLR